MNIRRYVSLSNYVLFGILDNETYYTGPDLELYNRTIIKFEMIPLEARHATVLDVNMF